MPAVEETVPCYSPQLIISDEAARVPDDLYRAIRPMLAVSLGRPRIGDAIGDNAGGTRTATVRESTNKEFLPCILISPQLSGKIGRQQSCGNYRPSSAMPSWRKRPPWRKTPTAMIDPSLPHFEAFGEDEEVQS
jgi:hypothetical protein